MSSRKWGDFRDIIRPYIVKAGESVPVAVSLDDKSARVKLNQNVSDDTFKKAVHDAGYELKGIE